MDMQFANKFTLTHHTKTVNVLAQQDILVRITWIDVDDHGETTFAFGASDGNIQIYERINDALFEFCSTTIGHSGPVELLAWDPMHRQLASASDSWPHIWNFTPDKNLVSITSKLDKQPYVARTVHFYDNGASILVSYLESGEMYVYHKNCDFTLTWHKKVQGRITGAYQDRGSHTKGALGALLLPGSCFDGHSSVKVWGEGKLTSTEDNETHKLPSVESLPASQLLWFAIICMLVNMLMHALQSGTVSELFLLLQGSVTRVIGAL
ncbi:uncharacterized protein EDB93DRAFT_1106661 [Suillus bovinus]|uniref:uncharacterized protein n=1 Tax=Suillus bovinus TaxID=48563 RepID=UPI001B87E185|nr:uncharacterized protein EDB93DRAFT_1106661 [Suillus bovinus]KAG2137110.1 hypothetical protein EDB93DRAFT_1106661 [Suillus bovinus]